MKFVDLSYENSSSLRDSQDRFRKIQESGKYLMGENVDALEEEFAKDQKSTACVLVKNATDALMMTFQHLNAKKRTVIVPQFGAYPTVMAAIQSGARDIIACSVDNTLTMDITSVDVPRDSIIVPVNLYGNRSNIHKIRQVADSVGGCTIVEDCAQSTGLEDTGLSDYLIHSFYPTKPMGCMGDGGAILTRDKSCAENLRKSRFYGIGDSGLIETWGVNSRIDEWQASFLLSKIHHYRSMNQTRKENASKYSVERTKIRYSSDCVYHQYVELYAERDKVRNFFTEAGVPTMIHYPKMLRDMPHLLGRVKFSDCRRVSDHVLSFPVGPHLRPQEIDLVQSSLAKVASRRLDFEEIL